MISNNSYLKIIDGLEQMALTNLWLATADSIFYDFPKKYSETYQGRIELFFIVLGRLIEEKNFAWLKRENFYKGQ